ncbi:hypothetical protein R3P38DRAFT_2761288 [Favolaschia claudopus]|uniref:Uncharacterized protein n=1 Tax=Favolaschia claudopus TaxID=2862362 RepID=A0AAW0DQP7_9AGAR
MYANSVNRFQTVQWFSLGEIRQRGRVSTPLQRLKDFSKLQQEEAACNTSAHISKRLRKTCGPERSSGAFWDDRNSRRPSSYIGRKRCYKPPVDPNAITTREPSRFNRISGGMNGSLKITATLDQSLFVAIETSSVQFGFHLHFVEFCSRFRFLTGVENHFQCHERQASHRRNPSESIVHANVGRRRMTNITDSLLGAIALIEARHNYQSGAVEGRRGLRSRFPAAVASVAVSVVGSDWAPLIVHVEPFSQGRPQTPTWVFQLQARQIRISKRRHSHTYQHCIPFDTHDRRCAIERNEVNSSGTERGKTYALEHGF